MGGLHLQFGGNASTELVASWHTTEAVGRPRVMLGIPTGGFGRTIEAETRTYRDALSGNEVRVNHARLTNLTPDTDYIYAAVHDGASPALGTVRTAPAGRVPLTFTSFGDQATPMIGRLVNATIARGAIGSPAAGDITAAIERIGPLFNLVNGDLCYANLDADRIRTWSNWFDNSPRSTSKRMRRGPHSVIAKTHTDSSLSTLTRARRVGGPRSRPRTTPSADRSGNSPLWTGSR